MRDRKGRPGKLKAGIKYCGGCRPEFDRIAAVKEMKEALGEAIEMVRMDDEEADFILVVTGCKTACVDVESLPLKAKKYISSLSDARRVMEELANKTKT